ncbi:MAG: DNA topoisomerase VI subunit B [Planctomycetota bacterium]
MAERIRRTAEDLGKEQRDISVSEFFSKNRHLLGFDNPRRALLTSVKEAVDNALDACEEAGILPEVVVEVTALSETRFKLMVEDNGPGIVKEQIPAIFAKLLYGSKFHRLRMSRGQQGIGISAAGMYGQLTTGLPIRILSRTAPKKTAHLYELMIDTTRNKPTIVKEEDAAWEGKQHGVRIEITLEGLYNKGRQSLDEYMRHTAIANPHANFRYKSPQDPEVVYDRVVKKLPPEPRAIKPHPYGVELGMLMRILAESRHTHIRAALMGDFCRVGLKVATDICTKAGVSPKAYTSRIAKDEAEKIYKAIQVTKIMSPPTDCIVPMGEDVVVAGLKKEYQADFYTSCTRPPDVYRGNPFQIEVGLAYGGKLNAEEPVELLRFANRVPLLYQKGACAITEAMNSTNWKTYGIRQSTGAAPVGPMVVLVHIASVWVPFTSESKEAIAHYPEIIKEIRFALQKCGREAGLFVSRRARDEEAERKKRYIEQYIPHIGIALRQMLKLTAAEEGRVVQKIKTTLRRSPADEPEKEAQ